MNKQILLDMGLSEREIAVYLALLKLGTSTTGAIVKHSKVPNSKIYEILDKLIEKGLVTYFFRGKIKYFQYNSPEILMDLIDSKRRILKETVSELNKLKEKEISDYKVSIYEGIRAIKSAFFEMYNYLGKNSEYCVFPIGEELGTEELIQFFAEVFHKRHTMNIKIRSLLNENLKEIFEKFYSHYKNVRVRYTPYKFPTGVFIFKDHVLNVIWSEKPVAFLIKSKQNYEKWQDFFDEQWKISSHR